MSDLLAEVDEIMRQERMVALWKEHGNVLIAFLVALILGTALISGYKSWNASVKQTNTQALVAVIDSPDFPANLQGEKLDMRAGPQAIALLTAAGEALQSGNYDLAVQFFNQVSSNTSTPKDLKQLALLAKTRAALSNDPAMDIEATLKPILKDPKSPWRAHARLETAAFLANKKGDFAAARAYLNDVQDTKNLPQSLYDKARALDHVYALQSPQTKPAE